MLAKDKVQTLIDKMPENFDADYLIEQIILLQKIEIARSQISNGEFLSDEDLDTEIASWK
ncbi:MAG TPA: hypothetical protein DIT07_14275 [Sphingobacteriaceae bacterium]|nr:hypothetical protein [Sphingobacteriaceae bacterium]